MVRIVFSVWLVHVSLAFYQSESNGKADLGRAHTAAENPFASGLTALEQRVVFTDAG